MLLVFISIGKQLKNKLMEPWKNSEQFGKPINRDALNNFGTRVSNIRGGGEKDNRGKGNI